MCPEISIKNKYSQFSSLVGIDSILVIDIRCLARISNAFDKDPALLFRDITNDVLSLFDRGFDRCLVDFLIDHASIFNRVQFDVP